MSLRADGAARSAWYFRLSIRRYSDPVQLPPAVRDPETAARPRCSSCPTGPPPTRTWAGCAAGGWSSPPLQSLATGRTPEHAPRMVWSVSPFVRRSSTARDQERTAERGPAHAGGAPAPAASAAGDARPVAAGGLARTARRPRPSTQAAQGASAAQRPRTGKRSPPARRHAPRPRAEPGRTALPASSRRPPPPPPSGRADGRPSTDGAAQRRAPHAQGRRSRSRTAA